MHRAGRVKYKTFKNEVFQPILLQILNSFYAAGLFLCPLKTSGNKRFSDIFRGYRKTPVAWNGLKAFLEKGKLHLEIFHTTLLRFKKY